MSDGESTNRKISLLLILGFLIVIFAISLMMFAKVSDISSLAYDRDQQRIDFSGN